MEEQAEVAEEQDMSEMVERVARAIYDVKCRDAPVMDGFGDQWQMSHPSVRAECILEARAAIAAMRDTAGTKMNLAAFAAVRDATPEIEQNVAVLHFILGWQAAIDEALKIA